MLYLILAAAALMVVLTAIAPRRYPVHAARPPASPSTGAMPWLTAGFATDEHGKSVDVTGKFIGDVIGVSMVEKGIPDGSIVVGPWLTAADRPTLPDDAIVVVKDRINETAKEAYCLRRVRSIGNGQVEYYEDGKGPHPPHPLGQMVARINFVIPTPQARPFFGFLGKAS
jgi:hypothetical protein